MKIELGSVPLSPEQVNSHRIVEKAMLRLEGAGQRSKGSLVVTIIRQPDGASADILGDFSTDSDSATYMNLIAAMEMLKASIIAALHQRQSQRLPEP